MRLIVGIARLCLFARTLEEDYRGRWLGGCWTGWSAAWFWRLLKLRSGTNMRLDLFDTTL